MFCLFNEVAGQIYGGVLFFEIEMIANYRCRIVYVEAAERASRIYAEAEEAEDFARETSSRPRGLVKLAVPLSFGVRWVAPLLPEFFRTYPDISVDLHSSDAQADLIGEGFDAALRIAVMEDSSLVARFIAPVRQVTSLP
jgi:DNA-binding transcriptional LysR family regulator